MFLKLPDERPAFLTTSFIFFFRFAVIPKKQSRIACLFVGNPAILIFKTRGFPSPLHNGFGFI